MLLDTVQRLNYSKIFVWCDFFQQLAIHAILETNISSAEVHYFAFRDIERHLPAACPLIECIDVSFKVKRSRSQGAGAYCGGLAHSLFNTVELDLSCLTEHFRSCMLVVVIIPCSVPRFGPSPRLFILYTADLADVVSQWRRKQFASGGHNAGALRRPKIFWCAPSLFSCAPPPHMRGHNDCLLPTERQLKWWSRERGNKSKK